MAGVVGGPGSFLVTADDFDDFARAMRRKLYSEIVGAPVAQAPQARPEQAPQARPDQAPQARRSEEHTSELQSLLRISYAVYYLKKKQLHLSNFSDNDVTHTHNNSRYNI